MPPVHIRSVKAAPAKGQGVPLVQIPGDVDQQRGYRVRKWREYPNYECIYCQYRTIFIHKMEKHQLEGEHPWAYPGQNPKTPGVPTGGDGPQYE